MISVYDGRHGAHSPFRIVNDWVDGRIPDDWQVSAELSVMLSWLLVADILHSP